MHTPPRNHTLRRLQPEVRPHVLPCHPPGVRPSRDPSAETANHKNRTMPRCDQKHADHPRQGRDHRTHNRRKGPKAPPPGWSEWPEACTSPKTPLRQKDPKAQPPGWSEWPEACTPSKHWPPHTIRTRLPQKSGLQPASHRLSPRKPAPRRGQPANARHVPEEGWPKACFRERPFCTQPERHHQRSTKLLLQPSRHWARQRTAQTPERGHRCRCPPARAHTEARQARSRPPHPRQP